MAESSEEVKEQKDFDFTLGQKPEKVRDYYYRLLNQERSRREEEKKGFPLPVSTKERREILKKAETLCRGEELYGTDGIKMGKDWDGVISKEGRPPIGGAQDD